MTTCSCNVWFNLDSFCNETHGDNKMSRVSSLKLWKYCVRVKTFTYVYIGKCICLQCSPCMWFVYFTKVTQFGNKCHEWMGKSYEDVNWRMNKKWNVHLYYLGISKFSVCHTEHITMVTLTIDLRFTNVFVVTL